MVSRRLDCQPLLRGRCAKVPGICTRERVECNLTATSPHPHTHTTFLDRVCSPNKHRHFRSEANCRWATKSPHSQQPFETDVCQPKNGEWARNEAGWAQAGAAGYKFLPQYPTRGPSWSYSGLHCWCVGCLTPWLEVLATTYTTTSRHWHCQLHQVSLHQFRHPVSASFAAHSRG